MYKIENNENDYTYNAKVTISLPHFVTLKEWNNRKFDEEIAYVCYDICFPFYKPDYYN